MFSDDMKGYRKLDFIPRMQSEEDSAVLDTGEADMEKIDILELSEKLIQSTSHSQPLKDKLVSTIKNLYEKVQKSQEKEPV